jgi:hypothetical protein
MKNITLSAQEEAIKKARQIASENHQTLNELFREWLDDFNYRSHSQDDANKLQSLWKQTSYLKIGGKLSREELHER